MVLLKDEENARSTIADVLNLSSDYSIHFTESHTDGPRKKKKVCVYAGRNPGHCQRKHCLQKK